MTRPNRRYGGRRTDDQLTRRRPGDGRDKMIGYKVDDDEHAATRQAATAAGLSMSDFAREAVADRIAAEQAAA